MVARWFTASAATAAAGALALGTVLAPAQAASLARWRIARLPTGSAQEFLVSAHGPGDAWVTGVTNSGLVDVERWDGRAWQRIAVPHLGHLGVDDPLAPVGSSSPSNAWIFPSLYRGTSLSTYALHWLHGHWTTQRLARHTTMYDTAVFSRTDAWAFGVIGSSSRTAPYDLRYNGRRWRMTTLPGAPYYVSALSADNMWTAGPSAATVAKPLSQQVMLAMHWNGHKWSAHRIPVPMLRRHALNFHIAAAGASDLWLGYVDYPLNSGSAPNGLLHWNRTGWHRLKLPAHFNSFVNEMIQDGRGGLFLCTPSDIYHYTGGRWIHQQLPGTHPQQIGLSGAAWIPGTTSAWAVGERAFHGIILKYGS